MSFIEGNTLSGYLRDSSRETTTLNSNISISILRKAYFSMAEVLLELSKPEFRYIGAIRQDDSGAWTISKRLFTFNMNRLAQFSNIPYSVFGQQLSAMLRIILRSSLGSISIISGFNATMQFQMKRTAGRSILCAVFFAKIF